MSYKKYDIVLVKFPFTDLLHSKKRPVLIVSEENKYGDFVCFQITSNKNQDSLLHIQQNDIVKPLSINSFVKYDKCFTLNSSIIDKKISSVNKSFLEKVKKLFCDQI